MSAWNVVRSFISPPRDGDHPDSVTLRVEDMENQDSERKTAINAAIDHMSTEGTVKHGTYNAVKVTA